MDWLKDNAEIAVSFGVGLVSGVWAFLRGVQKVRDGHDQLRKEFDAHMAKTEPLVASFIEVRERVMSLEERMDERLKAIAESIEEGREDVRSLNATVLQLLQRRFGSVRSTDQDK